MNQAANRFNICGENVIYAALVLSKRATLQTNLISVKRQEQMWQKLWENTHSRSEMTEKIHVVEIQNCPVILPGGEIWLQKEKKSSIKIMYGMIHTGFVDIY